MLGLIVPAALTAWLVGACTPERDENPAQTGASAVDRVKGLVSKGQFAEAEGLARRLLVEAEQASGSDSMEVAYAIDALHLAQSPDGDRTSDEAKQRMERAVKIKEGALGPLHLDVAFSLNALFQILLAREDLEEAERVAGRVVSIREMLLDPDDLVLGRAVANLALIEWRLGDFAAARLDYDRALEIFRSAGAPEYPDQGVLLHNLALALKDLGDYRQGRSAFERVVEIQERALGPVHRELGGTLENLCSLLRTMGDYSAARRACERCLEIAEVDPGPETGQAARARYVLADLLTTTGEVAAARPLVEHAIAVTSQWSDGENSFHAEHVFLLGRILALNGDLRGARSRLEQALAIKRRIFPADHLKLVEVRTILGEVQWKLGDVQAAWDSALGATAMARKNLREMASGLSARESIRYESTRESNMDLLLSLLLFSSRAAAPEDAASLALNEVTLARGVVLDEVASRHRSVSEAQGGDAEESLRRLVLARSRLSRLLVEGVGTKTPDRYRQQVLQAEEEADRAERELAARSADLRRRISREGTGLEEVAAALPRGGVLVAYVRFERILPEVGDRRLPSYMAFVLAADGGTPAAIPLGGAIEIDDLILRWRRAAGSNPIVGKEAASERAYREAGAALRERIWDPVASRLGTPDLALVVPDGLLSLVNFGTLPLPDGHYFIESGPLVHYLSAERDMVRDRPARPSPRRLLAVGGADFDAAAAAAALRRPVGDPQLPGGATYRSPPSSCRDLRALRFEPLGGSLMEIREIESIWSRKGTVFALTGSRAGEGLLKREAPGFDALHIATHGFFMEDCCASDPDAASRFESPMLLSGLALAGANTRDTLPVDTQEEDGILTVEEISTLDLSAVDWVVLSACGTGLGQVVSGEGVLGLRRAFEIAGAGTLIISLWNVEDDATRVWMRELYEDRLAGSGAAVAVRNASLKMLHEQRRLGRTTHPFYWGGFVAAGDWR